MCYIVICTPHNSQCNCQLLQFPLPWLLSHFTFIINWFAIWFIYYIHTIQAQRWSQKKETNTQPVNFVYHIFLFLSLSLYLPNGPDPLLPPHFLCVQNIAHYCTTTTTTQPTDHRRKSSSMYEVFNWGYSNDEPPKRFSLSIAGSEINIDGPVPVKNNAHKLTSSSTTTPPTTTTAHRQTTTTSSHNNNSYRKGEGSSFLYLQFLYCSCFSFVCCS